MLISRIHEITGMIIPQTARRGKTPCCGVQDWLVRGAERAADCRWAVSTLMLWGDPRAACGWSGKEWLAIYREGADAIMRACGVTLDWTDQRDQANITVTVAKVDSPGRTLAYAQMPCGGVYGPDRTLAVVMDVYEPWRDNGRDYTRAVWMHELCHALGLHHSASRKSLMYPLMTDVMTLDADTAERLAALYGPPKQAEPPRPTPQPAPPPPVATEIVARGPVAFTGVDGREYKVWTSSV